MRAVCLPVAAERVWPFGELCTHSETVEWQARMEDFVSSPLRLR